MARESRPWAPTLRDRLRRGAPALAAVTFATGWYLYLGYGKTLWPTDVQWMLRYDWTAALWGFSFYRNAAWSLPLGSAPALFYPDGTSVGFTDACPWMALWFKLLSPILPLDFQYFGLWFWLCYALQALFGERVTAQLTDDPVQRALGGCLFALTPLLPARHAHAALSGLFFVTAGLYLHLRPVRDAADARRLLLIACGLLAWAAGTHGYLSAMLIALALALTLRLTLVERVLPLRALPLAVLAVLGSSVPVYYLFGYLGWKQPALAVEGFGEFSADLLTLVNPQEWSRLRPPLPYRPRQWEGFGYLGLGVLGLLGLRTGVWLLRPRALLAGARRTWPLLLVLALGAFYALSNRVSWRGEEVWNLDRLYRGAERLTGVFRSSGRFVWPLHLALIAAAISGVAALRRRVLGRALLVVAVGLQAYELDPRPLIFDPVPLDPLVDPAWSTTGDHYRHLSLVPVHVLWVCRYDAHVVNRLAYEAYRRKLTFNSGNVMRMDPDVASRCERGLPPGSPLDPTTIYVIDPAFRPEFDQRGAVCGWLDGLLVCVSPERATPLREALRAHP